MEILTLILIIIGISAISKSAKQKQAREIARRKAEEQRIREDVKRMQREAKLEAERMRSVIREQMRQAKEQERQAAMLAKHEEQIAKLEFRMEQAEADILSEQAKLDHYTAKLSALDDELAKINSDIEFYQLANKYDAEKKAIAAREKVEDKIFSFEEKVRACEKRMAKAKYTIAEAERKMA